MGNVDPYLKIRQAYAPCFTRDGRRLVFLMNTTGTPQVYAMDAHGGWPDLLTDYDDRIQMVATSAATDWAVFGMDVGGNERQQLYALDLTDGRVFRLTPDSGAIFEFGAFDPGGDRVAYASTRRNGRDFDIYIQALRPDAEPQLVQERAGWWRVEDWSGDALLLSHWVTHWNQALYRFDLGSGRMERLTPSGGPPARYAQPALRGDRVYCVSDFGRDYAGLAVLPADGSGAVRWLATPDHDVEQLAVDAAGRRAVYSVNQDGYSAVWVHELSDGRSWRVAGLDGGVVSGLCFDPAGERVAAVYQSPIEPSNIRLFAASAGGPVASVTRVRPTGLDPDRFVRPASIRIPAGPDLEIPVFLYRPRQIQGARPVVVSIHGGPEAQERPGFNAIYQYFVEHGYIVAAPNVRGSTGYGNRYMHLDDKDKRMDAVADLARLAEWLRTQPDVDGGRIALMGGSYGGFMVLAGLAAYPDMFRAGVDIVGIANFETFMQNTGPWRRALREAEYGSLDHDRELLRRISPIRQVDRISAPLFVVHGANDPRVPVGEAEQIVEALRARGRRVEYVRFDDEGHGVVRLANRRALYPRIEAFLDEVFASP